jgi:tetratricopeptide (TPR) repeat protein
MVIDQSLFECARVYALQHNPSRAAAMLAEVEPRLRKSLPLGHYAFATLAAEQARVASMRGDIADAARASNQLQRNAQPGTFSSSVGRAYLSLGRALQAQGKNGEAHAALQSAVERLRNALGPSGYPKCRATRVGVQPSITTIGAQPIVRSSLALLSAMGRSEASASPCFLPISDPKKRSRDSRPNK